MKNVMGCIYVLLLLQCPAAAHEFWLAPQKFSYQAGEKVFLRWQVGEDFAGTNWGGNKEKAVMLRAFTNNYFYSLQPLMTEVKGDSVKLDTLNFAGNYTIAYQGSNSFIRIAADSFNRYLAEDGLANVIQWRNENGKDTAAGREYYQRCAKTLIRVKSTMKKSDYMKSSFVANAAGLALEIIPMDNPYNLKEPGTIPFNIYFQGRPVRDGLARVWHRVNGKTEVKTLQVIKGLVELPIDPTGTWMLSLVKMEPVKNDPAADWQSYWSSITWGYE
ncbi:MAG: DUF4198 domain-containing protein [Chitinophagaceae bacterium]